MLASKDVRAGLHACRVNDTTFLSRDLRVHPAVSPFDPPPGTRSTHGFLSPHHPARQYQQQGTSEEPDRPSASIVGLLADRIALPVWPRVPC